MGKRWIDSSREHWNVTGFATNTKEHGMNGMQDPIPIPRVVGNRNTPAPETSLRMTERRTVGY